MVSVQHEVHPEINFDYNSLLLVIGQTGSGKTFNVQNELVALSYIKHDFVQIVYVTNNPNDLTVLKMKELITVPIDFVSYDESEEYISELREYIQAYDEIKENHLENVITEECKYDILEHLHLNDFKKKNIYTIIIYDDAMNVLQSMKGLLSEVKAQLGGLWLFGGFNRQQFCYMMNQICLPISKESFWEIYRKTPKHNYFYIHNTVNGIFVYLIDENGDKYLINEEN